MIAMPVQVGGIWVAVGWAGQALILLAIAARFRSRHAALVRLPRARSDARPTWPRSTPSTSIPRTFWPVVNWRFLAFGVGIAALYTAQWIVSRIDGEFDHTWAKDEAGGVPKTLFGLATLATLWLLSAEVIASADSALFDSELIRAGQRRQSSDLTLVWGVYGAGLMLAGVLGRLALGARRGTCPADRSSRQAVRVRLRDTGADLPRDRIHCARRDPDRGRTALPALPPRRPRLPLRRSRVSASTGRST